MQTARTAKEQPFSIGRCVVPENTKIQIEPHTGIAALKLGMTPEQILTAIQELSAEFGYPKNQIQITKDINGNVVRYQAIGLFLFLVEYQKNRAVEITVNCELGEYVPVTLFGIDCFHTLAEDLLQQISAYDSFSCDEEDMQLGTTYVFEKLGIRLWREHAFHTKLLMDAAYMKNMADVLEDEYQYQYFQIVGVKK